jgi:hypothetical protein
MPVNRISRLSWQAQSAQQTPASTSESFVACPACAAFGYAMGMAASWVQQQELFRIAYDNAKAQFAAPSFYRLFSNWN